ncbi:MAG: SET domain-containing protein-lysine N-methyltransferase [Metallibacterium scheffleri]|jgi:hypothetical protein|uniref:SET domain-containing protein n=1 Tax=Metallibacterium scheffleri TaxID=993689 RepID=UPI0026EEB6F7|nr:SET domain-containing protein-lysine N-methyltransferase [Metallibacterium scheffleri]MCK9366840.1 SET domain-containing protein-lysine N-methyltransferase [Metallibacterium scheffleri]
MPARFQVRRSAIHGNGVFARRALAGGSRVLEYKGRLITHAEANALYEGSIEQGHTFLFDLNEHYIIDGNQGGNSARWINHSCAPNCRAEVHVDSDGDALRDRVIIEALRDIAPGEELTYNYGIVLDVPHTPRLKRLWACRCGAAQCTGTLLQPRRRVRAA